MSILESIRQLNRSERGRQAMRDMLTTMDNGAVSLDAFNQDALLCLMRWHWQQPATVRALIQDTLK